MTPARPSAIAAVVSILWPLFITCTVLIALVWISGFGPGMLADPDFAPRIPKEARQALGIFSRALDPLWITLGAVVTYLALVRAEGLSAARRWSGMVLIGAVIIGALSVLAGVPLGPVFFPPNLGIKFGPVPFAWPFLWLLIVVGARDTLLRAFPRLSHAASALLVGVACAGTALILDPVAWKYRAWWLWYPTQLVDVPDHAPWSAYATWLVAGAGLAFIMRSPHVIRGGRTVPITPMVCYAIVNGVALLTRLLR